MSDAGLPRKACYPRRATPPHAAATVVDLSHELVAGMPMYPGLPGPVIEDQLSRADSQAHYAPGVSFQVSRLTLVGSTGTYIDSPFHRFRDGADVADLPLNRLVNLPGIVVKPGTRGGRLVLDEADLQGLDFQGKAVLVRTGWDRLWDSDAYYAPGPYLSAGAARAIAWSGAALVGVDCLNIDDTEDLSRPAHTELLAAGVPIIENLRNLGSLPRSGFCFFAAPVAVQGVGSMPVRAFALLSAR